MKRAARGAAWGAAITRNAALSPFVGREGQPHTPSHRGTDSAEPPPNPSAEEGADTHIIWNGEFMRGGLSRSIQTCCKRQRQSRRGSGGGGGLGGGHGHSGQPALTAGLTATSEKLTQEGKGRASGEVTRAPLPSPPPHSPAAPPQHTPPISPPIATTSSPLQWGSPGAAPHVHRATIHTCSLREFRSLTPQQGSTRPGPHRAAAQVFLLCHLPPPCPHSGS